MSVGLERFPANESLLLRLVKGSAKRGGASTASFGCRQSWKGQIQPLEGNGKRCDTSSCRCSKAGSGLYRAREQQQLRCIRGVSATVRVPGVMGPPAPPTLQLTRTLTSPGSASRKQPEAVGGWRCPITPWPVTNFSGSSTVQHKSKPKPQFHQTGPNDVGGAGASLFVCLAREKGALAFLAERHLFGRDKAVDLDHVARENPPANACDLS